jgi:hypothetical protein
VFEGDAARHMDQVQLPMSDQGVLAETLPETMARPKPYVYVSVPPNCDYLCSRLLSLFLTLRTRMTQRRTPSTKWLSHHQPTFLFKYPLYLPTEVNTPLQPRRVPKHRDIVACPSSDLNSIVIYIIFSLVVHLVSH